MEIRKAKNEMLPQTRRNMIRKDACLGEEITAMTSKRTLLITYYLLHSVPWNLPLSVLKQGFPLHFDRTLPSHSSSKPACSLPKGLRAGPQEGDEVAQRHRQTQPAEDKARPGVEGGAVLRAGDRDLGRGGGKGGGRRESTSEKIRREGGRGGREGGRE
jgi:hypothetical protein